MRHKFKKGKKSFREKFHHWRKRSIYNKATAIAHRNGIRISTVNPAGTSKYAFDGSGEVTRDKDNYSMCTFTTSKRYNCDLSASYNIAARYIVRSIIKPLDENSRLDLETKASLSLSGTKVTYHTLDLSASYNIAARYIVRSIIKPLDENSRLDLETKASLSLSGTKVTYHTLMELLKVTTI